MAAALSLTEADLAPTAFGNFEGGPCFQYVELADLDALARATITEPGFTKTRETAGDTGAIYAYVRHRPQRHPGPHVRPTRRHRRGPGHGLGHRDPRGTASGHRRAHGRHQHLDPATGRRDGPPSDLRLSIDVAKGAITAIRVAGRAVKVGATRLPQRRGAAYIAIHDW
jgi:trans-2,3-dihydro-3-hydroxyanthranilate isomerase